MDHKPRDEHRSTLTVAHVEPNGERGKTYISLNLSAAQLIAGLVISILSLTGMGYGALKELVPPIAQEVVDRAVIREKDLARIEHIRMQDEYRALARAASEAEARLRLEVLQRLDRLQTRIDSVADRVGAR